MHNEAIALYRECKNIEKIPTTLYKKAVEDKFIEFMVNKDTGLIEDNIPTVLEYLFTNDTKVTSKEIK